MSKQAQIRYDSEHTVQVKLKLNTKTDADILRKLDNVDNKQGYIKDLIRSDNSESKVFVVYRSENGVEIQEERLNHYHLDHLRYVFKTREDAAEAFIQK